MNDFIDLIKSIVSNGDEEHIGVLVEENVEWAQGKALVFSGESHTTAELYPLLQEAFKRGVIAALELAIDDDGSVIDLDDEGDNDDDEPDDDDDSDEIDEAAEAEENG